MLSASQRILFLRAILACPPLLPTVYARDSDDKQKSSTKLEPSQVPGNVVPKVLMLEAADTMLHPLKMAFSDFLSSLEFPDDMLDEGSLVRQSHRDAMLQAERVAPSGENGISHFLKSSLFDQINRILYRFFPDEDRFWRAIGIGRSGKTDWGLYLNGVLVVVVELKPHIVSNGQPHECSFRIGLLTLLDLESKRDAGTHSVRQRQEGQLGLGEVIEED